MRVRLRYAKFGKVRFVSHRDMARVWERTLRRAELPVAYTEGFTPRPKMHFGLALSTGYESYGEYLDIDFHDAAHEDDAVSVEGLPGRLSPLLPEGVVVEMAEALVGKTESLQQAVTSCSWHIEFAGPGVAGAADRVGSLLAANEIPMTRKRKGKDVSDDIRPLLVDISVKDNEADRAVLVAELGTQPRALRARELVDLIGSECELTRATRLQQWTTSDGAKREPLPLAATRTAPHPVGAI